MFCAVLGLVPVRLVQGELNRSSLEVLVCFEVLILLDTFDVLRYDKSL